MAITLAAITGAAAAYFAGVTAIANIATVYREYRKSHPKGSGTAARSGYVAQHYGRTIKCAQPLEWQENEFYKRFLDLLPEICRGPKLGKRASIKARWDNSSLKKSLSRSRSSSSGRGPRPQLWGELELIQDVQGAPDTHRDHFVGLNTGKKPTFNLENAEEHWKTLKSEKACDASAAPTIAVVNWTTQIITVFIKSDFFEQTKGLFFRNYRVYNSNLYHFATEFQNHMAFTGIIHGGRLVGTSSEIFLAEDDPEHNLKSRNTWKLLGLQGETDEECVFMEMVRAALFGLIDSLYEKPTLVNVDMLDGGDVYGKEFVHVDTPDPVRLQYNADSIFSVFAFNALDYAKERVLVG